MKKPLRFFLCLLFWILICSRAGADPLTDRLVQLKPGLDRQFSVPIGHWRFHQPDVAGAEQPDFGDNAWSEVAPGFSWSGENTKVWFRAKVTIPATVAGQSVAGRPVRLELGMDDDGALYVDGRLKEAFHWDDGRYTLTEHARPGQSFWLAVRGINGPGSGQLHFARLNFDLLPEFNQYLDEVKFVALLAGRVPADAQTVLKKALKASEGKIQFTEITPGNLDLVHRQLTQAQAALAPATALTRKYDVYYVGHAHIDMNWLWDWPETIDVCHRTWDSAMNLMDEFPQFNLVQSQPGAYVPIEEKYPQEFARMQKMAARGQWDLVGGMWNESDTDLSSGEGLARSFLLGQRYFQAHFGKYAVTGWLPDTFGHTWQLPQIMRLAGLRYFYHMRCGNGMEFTWWESPDGSRVLKANTASYDTDANLDQLAVPAENQARFDLPQSLEIFGVGDHGGGPTREQILRIQSFQNDPVLPRVHFVSADDFFGQLAQQPSAASLPVIDTELQYTLEGCYTTHADIKKALRQSENNLYTAEVLSSLAALTSQAYPVESFRAAWEPTAFAQFHDIICGSAIHSSYDWMHEQLVPAFRLEQEQTDNSLKFLAANADTRGPGAEAIVVWNPLSSARDDVARVPLTNAAQFHSVVDKQGRHFPAQVMDETNLVFVARDVPAFGQAVFFPETNSCPSDGLTLNDAGDAYDIQTPRLTLQIDKTTGAITRLSPQSAHWNVFENARDGNALQLLGDAGDAWVIQYTGENKILTTEGAKVSVLDQGPVFARVRVAHAFGKSSYTQDVTVYGALSRIDIPTTVNWQEEHELLKIRLPVNVSHPEAQAQIPFGSIARPANGQECPGQKWMEVSQTVPAPVTDATPLDLSPLFNSRCAENFDGSGNAFAAELLPAAGCHQLGSNQVPFNLPGSQSNQVDNIVPSGQQLTLPAHPGGDTLYLLAARVNGSDWTDIGFRLGNGTVESRAFPLNDWEVNAFPDNAIGLSFAYRQTPGGRQTVPPKMWIIEVPLPKNATGLVLPRDPGVHLFAATIATKPPTPTLYGLSVLNDCKYGFDISNNVFRLTALRSSSNPDPHPDQGWQQFTYSLYPHAGDWRTAHTDAQALALNIPLLATVTTPHSPALRLPSLSLVNIGGKGNLIVSALKHSEDGRGFILRFYEADGQDTRARINFGQPMQVAETDILERPLAEHPLTVQGDSVTLPVGHNQIVTLHFWADSEKAISQKT
jgi:alpha-mannosidase